MSTERLRLESSSGLRVEVNANGSIRRIEHGDIIVNLFLGNEIEGGPANLYLRHLQRPNRPIEWVGLLGPGSPATFEVSGDRLLARGEWEGIRFAASLILAQNAPVWFWQVTLENVRNATEIVDLIYAQDLALAHYGAVRLNEYYVSQYVDYTPLQHPERGTALAVRQNLSMGGRQPWALLGSLRNCASFATDALQLHGLATRSFGIPAGLAARLLPGVRRQHEHSMAVLQESPLSLPPGSSVHCGFFVWLEADHPAASSNADLAFIDRAMTLPEAAGQETRRGDLPARKPADTLFSTRPLLPTLDLTEDEITTLFGADRREVERDEVDGSILSFFSGADGHVALRKKEIVVLRPHGHILRSGDHLTPDEASLTSTAWMSGVFHSMVTQGHVSINRFLSTTRSYLGLLRSGGLRVFVELEDTAGPRGYCLLNLPSAFAMTSNGCRWIYKYSGGLIEVRSEAALDRHELGLSIEVLAGKPCRFLLSHHVAMNGDDGADPIPVRFTRDRDGIAVTAVPDSDVGRRFPEGSFRIAAEAGTQLEQVGGDELVFADGHSRNQPFLVVVTAPSRSAKFHITGHLIASSPRVTASGHGGRYRGGPSSTGLIALEPPASSPLAGDVTRLREILPWFAHNALIHYLAPRGLEQFSGGGWGTRDVCQGPVEMLLMLGEWAPVRDLLVRVFSAQNPDGDWPQWFMFFDRERNIRPGDSHGDIVFWPLLALGKYLLASEDASLLDAPVPFFHLEGERQAEKAPLWTHVERALAVIAGRVIRGTHLAAYGHGDWNDSLQPVDPAMREQLCSAWTVTLHYETVNTLSAALRHVGREAAAQTLDASTPSIREDFQRLLVVDDVLTGLAYFHDQRRVDYLLHPRDEDTGIDFSLLPMIHAVINGLLTPEQARKHLAIIAHHLRGPDGARLFDRPFRYRGGPQRYFQRAESSTYFGREIGIMYMHAHLRYAECLARHGDADDFFLALQQANPVGIRSAIPTARLRQANCYYSSSDADIADRYEAAARYDEIMQGKIGFEGGWRVYSSGAGIALRLIHECFLGLRRGRSWLGIDPVIPRALDAMRAVVELEGATIEVEYRIAELGHGPLSLILNGSPLPFDREKNPYRTGGAVVPMSAVRERLGPTANTLTVELG